MGFFFFNIFIGEGESFKRKKDYYRACYQNSILLPGPSHFPPSSPETATSILLAVVSGVCLLLCK